MENFDRFLQNKNVSFMAVVFYNIQNYRVAPIKSGTDFNNGFQAGGPGDNLTQPNMHHDLYCIFPPGSNSYQFLK